MNSLRKGKITIGTKMTPQLAFKMLFLLFWTQNTIMDFVVQIVKRLPIIGMLGNHFVFIIAAILIVLSFPYLVVRIRGSDVLFYLVAIGVLLLTILFLPQNGEYISKDLWRILVMALPVYFLGVCYDHELLKINLYWASLFGVVAMFAYQIYCVVLGREVHEDNMDAAYNVLPSVVFLIYFAFQNKNVRNWLFVAIGCILVFLFGTRGPIIIIILYGAIEVFINYIWMQSRRKKASYSMLLIVGLAVLLCTDIILEAAIWLAAKFEEIGFSTRIFDFFIEGDFTKSVGRNTIYSRIADAIADKYVFGYGIMGDRIVLQGTQQLYAHNFFTEIWCEFGVFFGSFLIMWVAYLILKALLKPSKNRMFILMITIMVMTKLMLSGSYLVEPYFYLLLGACVGAVRFNQKDKRY